MHRLRSKHKKPMRKILNQQELAQQRLIEISVMPEREGQLNEADKFAQKLSPKYAAKPKDRSISAHRPKTCSHSSQREIKSSQKFFGSCSLQKKANDVKPLANISTVKMICVNSSNPPSMNKSLRVQTQNSRSLVKSFQKSNQRRHMSFSMFSRIHEKCESMRSRLKKDLNQEVLSAFHVNNIKLQNRYEKYIRSFKLLKS